VTGVWGRTVPALVPLPARREEGLWLLAVLPGPTHLRTIHGKRVLQVYG
jgi:hypothetical protein